MITHRAGLVIPSTNNVLSKKLDTVDILSPMLTFLVCYINQPPFKSVGASQNIGLPGSHQNIVGNAVFHIEQQRNVEELRTSFVCFYGKQIRAFFKAARSSSRSSRYNNHAPASRRQVFRSDKSGYLRRERHARQIAGFATGQRKSFATIRSGRIPQGTPDAGWWNPFHFTGRKPAPSRPAGVIVGRFCPIASPGLLSV